MRNLKRALSLALASVMLLGMMVVGTSAASYTDVDDNDNVEAIEVLNAVNVMIGRQGNFEPDEAVNRHEMAVIMAKLVLGVETADNYVGSHPFTDVVPWADKYVAACYENGLVAGTSATTYGGNNPLTAVQAAAMMLRALGYKDLNKGYQGDWRAPITAKANEIRLFSGVASNPSEKLTRNQVAQLALNTLKSPMVTLIDGTFTATGENGQLILTGGSREYRVIARSDAYARAISAVEFQGSGSEGINGYTVELGEHLYNGKLKLNNDDIDVFGRPARTWTYDGNEIGSYAKEELRVASYTAGVTGHTVYDKLGQSTIRDNELDAYVDGEDNTDNIVKGLLVRSNENDLPNTGRGVLTEIYLDNDKERITIVSINTYLAQADSDYNEGTKNISLTVYDDSASSVTKLVPLEDVPAIANLKKDDWVLINWADETANKQVVDVFKPEIMENVEVTGFNSSKEQFNDYDDPDDVARRVTDITTGGTTYKNNRNAWYKQNTLNNYSTDRLVDKTYTIYMDQYGYFIGAELYSGKDQYVFIAGYDRTDNAIATSTANASAIFTDGSMSTIKVNVADTNKNIDRYNTSEYGTVSPANTDYNRWTNRVNHEEMWYTYTLRNDVYTLTPAARWTRHVAAAETTIQSNRVRLVPTAITPKTDAATGGTGNSYGDDASVYITVSMGDVSYTGANFQGVSDSKGITDIDGVYTGVQNVKLLYQAGSWAHSVYEADGSRIVAAIVLGEAEGVVDNYAFIRTGAYDERVEKSSETRNGGDYTHYWKVDVIMNGKLETREIKSKWSATAGELIPGTVQELILDTDGYITKINSLPNSLGTTNTGTEYSDNDTINITVAADRNKDKVYSNYDYINNATAGKPDSADLADYSVYDINIGASTYTYDGVTVDNTYGAGALSSTACPWSSSYTYANLSVANGTIVYNGVGGTDIFLGGAANDLGLTYVKDAPAAVYHQVGNKMVYDSYTSVEAAFRAIYDANPNMANGSNMKQFSGRVVAALDSNGRAKWVFFHDYTPAPNSDPNYDQGFNGRGIRVELGETVTQVNALLASGNDVTVNGNWLPADTAVGNQFLRVPAGRTLYINGNFNTIAPLGVNNVNTNTSSAGGKIVVNGDVTINQATAGAMAYDLTTMNGGDLKICNGSTITISMSGTVKIDGDIRGLDAAGTSPTNQNLEITGHVEAGNVNVNGGGTVVVKTVNSLIADSVTGKLYLNNTSGVAGANSTNNGYVKISGSVTEFYNYNVSQAATRTPEIGSATTFVNGAGTTTIVTDSWNPTNATLGAGSTITFQGDGEATGNAAGLFVNASGVYVDTKDSSITVGATAGTIASGSVTQAITVANDTTAPYSIGEITYTFANDDPTKPVMNVEVIQAQGGTGDVYVAVTVGDAQTDTRTQATGFTNNKKTVTFPLTGNSTGQLDQTMVAGKTFNFSVQLMSAATNGNKIGEAKSTSYTQAQTYSVTVASGDVVEFYTSNLQGATALAANTNFAANTKLYVKLTSAAASADSHVFDTTKVTAVPGQAGWYTFNLTGNVTGATTSTLVIAKVELKGTAASNVEIYEDEAATQTKVSTDKKFVPGTWLYVKLSATGTSDGGHVVTSIATSETKVKGFAETSAGSGIYKFQIMEAIATPDTLFYTK